MKKILIATDFSAESKNAIKYIIEFFESMSSPCHIYLLNAFMDINLQDQDPVQRNDQAKQASKEKLAKEVEATLNLAKNKGLKIEPISHMGSLTNVIPKIITREKIDLVVMGKNGGRNVKEVSKELKSAKSTCPLLIVFHHASE